MMCGDALYASAPADAMMHYQHLRLAAKSLLKNSLAGINRKDNLLNILLSFYLQPIVGMILMTASSKKIPQIQTNFLSRGHADSPSLVI